jgi:hypothetical protein
MSSPKNTYLRDVFGVGRDVPLNYVARPSVDDAFVGSLTRDKHVVVYGSSKQGKTTLRKHCLKPEDFIVVSCLNTMTLEQLHGAVLKAAGYRLEQTQTKSESGSWKFGAELSGEGKVPFVAKASAKGTVAYETQDKADTISKKLELDLSDVNDIVTALEEARFSKFIVLEDFHYLPIETQRRFAFALKAFHENSKFCFIVVGVWREKNRLIYFNGDLTNRVVSIDADIWTKDQLIKLIQTGEELLNIEIDQAAKDSVIVLSLDSVSIVQEACYKICEAAGINEFQKERRIIGADVDVGKIVDDIVNEQAARYLDAITNFSEGFQQTDLEMYKWLMYAILKSSIEQLEGGLRRGAVSAAIKAKHPEGNKLNEGNITQALQNAASLQVQKGIRPIIFDYDQGSRVLTVVDRSFLIWLGHQNVDELISELGIE